MLTELKPAEVDLDGMPGIALAGDLEPPPGAEPWAALLPALDSTPMGWQRREWFLGEHASRLFDRNGNVRPTLWWDGRIVGGRAQDRDGRDRLPVPGGRRRRGGRGGRCRGAAAARAAGRRPADRPHPRDDLAGTGTQQLTTPLPRTLWSLVLAPEGREPLQVRHSGEAPGEVVVQRTYATLL